MLQGLAGTVNEGAVAGDINAAIKNGMPHLTGQLTLDELDLDPFAAMVLGDSPLESARPGMVRGSVPAEGRRRHSAPISTLPRRRSQPACSRLPTTPACRSGWTMRACASQIFPRKLFGGEVTGLFELKNNDGTGLFSGQMKLDDADLAAVLGDARRRRDRRRLDRAFGQRQIGRRPRRLAVRLGNGGIPVTLAIQNVNPLALPQFIARADQFGKDIDAAKTAGFAPGIAVGRQFRGGSGGNRLHGRRRRAARTAARLWRTRRPRSRPTSRPTSTPAILPPAARSATCRARTRWSARNPRCASASTARLARPTGLSTASRWLSS